MKICAQCKAPIIPRRKTSAAREAVRVYCSRSCANASRRAPIEEIIFNNSVKDHDTGCWNWTESRDKKGYGRLTQTGGEVLAHRVSWVHFNKSPVPKGLHVMHKCDNPRCINPDHLMIGTNADNQADKINKGRHRGPKGETNCKAKLTETDVLAILQDNRSHAAVGRTYGVSYSTVSEIRAGQTWKHVPRLSPHRRKLVPE